MPSLLVAILFALVALMAVVGADQSSGCLMINGNTYCSAVKAITYTNFGNAGTYREVTGMFSDGHCTSKFKNFNGALAPLNEEVSFHFRGPLVLKQFAVYNPAAVQERTTKVEGHSPRHVHKRFHGHEVESAVKHGHGHEKLKRADDQWVTATINGNIVSWKNDYTPVGSLPTAVKSAANDWVTATINGEVVSWTNSHSPGVSSATSSFNVNQMGTVVAVVSSRSSAISSKASVVAKIPSISSASISRGTDVAKVSTPSSATTSKPTAINQMGTVIAFASPKQNTDFKAGVSTKWTRQAYYDAKSQTVEGLVFLNNDGGQSSGVFDLKFGNSLSYASCDAKTGAASPQILADSMLEDRVEVIIFSDKKCKDDCGFIRPGTVAYHGFGGASKAFLLEFSMPLTGKIGWEDDMPSVWILNALIPRTLQYGEAECNCWESGCGEWDIFEVLDSGNTRAKSTVHADVSGGDSDYFDRPHDKTIKVAVVFDEASNAGHIRILDDNVEFDVVMSADEIAAFCGQDGAKVFHLEARK